MPAAAVIPAPIAYIKVVAVKKLVVGFLWEHGSAFTGCTVVASCRFGGNGLAIKLAWSGTLSFTVKKLECSKQA